MIKQAKKLHKLFSGLERAHGAYILNKPKPAKGKYKGGAVTKAEPVTDDLWMKHLAGQRGLGIVPIRDDSTVMFGAIDIDVYDLDISMLSKRLAVLELPLILCRTKSGGAHLYLFLSEPLEAAFIRGVLGAWAAELGFSGSEIFPKQNRLANEKDIGNWINMPYYHNNKKTDRYAVYNEEKLNLDTFLALAEEMKADESKLEGFLYDEPEAFEDGPPCMQTLSRRGFPEGSRNNSLFNIGVYLKLRFGDDWESHLDEYNRDYINPPLDHKEVAQVLRNVRKTKAFYRCTQPPICDACNRETCRTRKFGIGTNENKEPGVTVDQITQLRGESYYWIMQVQGERIEVSTDEMLSYRLFERKVVETLRILPNPMKNDAWKRYIKDKITNCEVIEVPEDAGDRGIFFHYLESFCTSNAMTKEKEGLLRGKPYLDKNRIFFRLPDLVKFLDQQRVKNVNRVHIWQWLGEQKDVKHHQFNIKGKCVKCWSITDFEEQVEEFDVPKVDVGVF